MTESLQLFAANIDYLNLHTIIVSSNDLMFSNDLIANLWDVFEVFPFITMQEEFLPV